MRIYIGCFGSGLGHASRMLEVAALLTSRGHDVEMSSSGEVAVLIRKRGYRCNSLPLADVKYSASGEFLVKDSLLDSPQIVGRTYKQLGAEVRNMTRFDPDAILSDSALSTVLAGRFLRLPIFTVLNQLNLTSSHGGERALQRLLSVGTSAGMGKLWELSDEVLLPDLPPPYTISERNLWGSNVQKTRYIGFLAASGSRELDGPATEFVESRTPKVFWQVSGPPRTRTPFLSTALRAAEALEGKYTFVVTAGDPTSTRRPTRIPGGWLYDWCPNADLYFDACDLVVSRAGHGTIGQAITARKPSLLVPIPKQPEQEGNAEKAQRLGLALVRAQDELQGEAVPRALDSLLAGGYAAAAQRVGDLARTYDAAAEVVRTVERSA